MMIGGKNDSLLSDINVTPFVDVMLVLLIIFMVTAPMMMQGVDVALPEATSDPLPSDQEQLMVTIDKNNQLYINDFQIGLDFLQEKLKKIIEGRKDREVFASRQGNFIWHGGPRDGGDKRGRDRETGHGNRAGFQR